MKIINNVYIVMFLMIIFFVGYKTYTSEKESYAFYENRELAEKPEFDVKTFVKDDFFKNYDTYYSDHFYKKNEILELGKEVQYGVKKGFGSEEVFLGDMMIDENHYMIKIPYEQEKEKDEVVEKYAKSVIDLAKIAKERGKIAVYVNNPYKSANLRTEVPKRFGVDEKYEARTTLFDHISKEVTVIDVATYYDENYKGEKKKELFYGTDHHWNQKGAEVAFKYTNPQITKMLGEEVKELEKLEQVVYESKNFLGSWSRELNGIFDERGSVTAQKITKEMNEEFSVKHYKNGKFNPIYLDSMYGPRTKTENIAGDKKIGYGHVHMNDLPEFVIENKKPISDKTLLILKDSFFNATVVDYARYYKKIIVIDPRHDTNKTVEERVAEYEYDALIFFYSDNVGFTQRQFEFNHKK